LPGARSTEVRCAARPYRRRVVEVIRIDALDSVWRHGDDTDLEMSRPGAGTSTRPRRARGSTTRSSNVISRTKAMTALCAHMLVDAGSLDMDSPAGSVSCARAWPRSLGARTSSDQSASGAGRLAAWHASCHAWIG
jgi:hypothetical protein